MIIFKKNILSGGSFIFLYIFMLFWSLLVFIGTFFDEMSNIITKKKSRSYHIITLGVITTIFALSIFIVSGIYKYFFSDLSLSFSTASIPFLILRLFLEILQSYYTLIAIQHANRTTFSMVRMFTIPLLVIADLLLWYSFSLPSFIGIFIILISFLIFNLRGKTLDMTALKYVIFITVNAVFTTTLFKYSLTHYHNSVEIDQSIMLLWILIFFMSYNYKIHKETWVAKLFSDKHFFIQWIAIALANIVLSYSFLYLNASISIAIKRVWEVVWSLVSGKVFFQEQHIFHKIILACFLITGVLTMLL